MDENFENFLRIPIDLRNKDFFCFRESGFGPNEEKSVINSSEIGFDYHLVTRKMVYQFTKRLPAKIMNEKDQKNFLFWLYLKEFFSKIFLFLFIK